MNEVAELREKILVMRELNNIRAEVVSIADRVERIPEMLLQIEFIRRDIQVALVLLRKMTAPAQTGREPPHVGVPKMPVCGSRRRSATIVLRSG